MAELSPPRRLLKTAPQVSRQLLPPLLITAASVVLAGLAERWLGLREPAVLILLGVLIAASTTTAGPALLAALLGFVSYNVLFIEPRYSLHIGSRAGWVTGAVFLACALWAGRLASRLAMQISAQQVARQRSEAREQLARMLLAAEDEAAIARAAALSLSANLDVQAELLPFDPEPARVEIERSDAWLLPLPGPEGPLAALRLRAADGGPPELDAAQNTLLSDLMLDIAQGLLRLRLASALHGQRLANESERLRSALLASVSHDLRSPLSGIIGAAGTLESYLDELDEDDRRSLLQTIREEGQRLDRHIQNLLDMTRLGHQALALQRDWIGVDELVGAVVARVQRIWPAASLEISIQPDLPPVWVHAALVEQALFNVLENALAFSAEGEPISLVAGQPVPGWLHIEVLDRGPGIPEADRERIFDAFHSVERGDRGRPGTGLGLAISRGMIEAHGGQLRAEARSEGPGSCFRFELPMEARPA